MVHCGYEATRGDGDGAQAAGRPWRRRCAASAPTAPMAPEIPLDGQRPAEYVFSRHVETAVAEIRSRKTEPVADAAD